MALFFIWLNQYIQLWKRKKRGEATCVKASLQATRKNMWRWIIRERMVWQWTQLSREEPRGLQQIVCRLNSTTCPQGPNNRKTLRNTHCCSDCHIPQIINCQGSCHPPPTPSPSSSSLFFLSPSLSHSAASRWCAGAQLVPHYLLALIRSIYPWVIIYCTEQGKEASTG